MSSQPIAVQDAYPDDFAHCFGCGRLNHRGHMLRTFLDGTGTVSRFTPEPSQMALPGFVYGGLLASLVDCHGMATASAAALRERGKVPGDEPSPRYVTAMLHVDFVRPTPLGGTLELRGAVEEYGPRKVRVAVTVLAGGVETVRGSVIAVPLPESMRPGQDAT